MDKDKSPFKDRVIAGVAAGSTAAVGRELLNIESSGGVTNKLVSKLDKARTHLPHSTNVHISRYLTKRLPTVGLGTVAGLVSYDYLKDKTKSKLKAALGAGLASSLAVLPVAYHTNAFPKELMNSTKAQTMRRILTSRVGQSLMAAPVGYLTYDYLKKKSKEKTGKENALMAAIGSGIVGTAATLPLSARYEGLTPKIEAGAKALGSRLEKKFPILTKDVGHGLTAGHYIGRVAKNMKWKIPAGVAGVAMSYPAYDLAKRYLEKRRKNRILEP